MWRGSLSILMDGKIRWAHGRPLQLSWSRRSLMLKMRGTHQLDRRATAAGATFSTTQNRGFDLPKVSSRLPAGIADVGRNSSRLMLVGHLPGQTRPGVEKSKHVQKKADQKFFDVQKRASPQQNWAAVLFSSGATSIFSTVNSEEEPLGYRCATYSSSHGKCNPNTHCSIGRPAARGF